MPRDLAIALLSGGMDSCVCAAIAAQEHELALLHVGYGQRTAARERRAFEEIADFYGVRRRLVCSLDYMREIGGSSLTDERIPVSKKGLDAAGDAVPTSYVPFRNTHLIAVAVSWGEALGARSVYIGAVEADSSGYPDCRPEYYEAYNRLIKLGTRPETALRVVTPVIEMSKAEIVRRGLELGAPLQLTWSCYEREDMACGQCDSCRLRLRAFEEAGVPDPIPYVSAG